MRPSIRAAVSRDLDAVGLIHVRSWQYGYRAGTHGYRALTLWVLTANDGARRFYEYVGFAPD